MMAEIRPAGRPVIRIDSGGFGSELIELEKIDKINYGIRKNFISWDPHKMASRIQVVATWINLIKVHLQTVISEGKVKPRWPFFKCKSDYISPWEDGPRLLSMRMEPILPSKDVNLATKDEIINLYSKLNGST
jgi:hypothetical protein